MWSPVPCNILFPLQHLAASLHGWRGWTAADRVPLQWRTPSACKIKAKYTQVDFLLPPTMQPSKVDTFTSFLSHPANVQMSSASPESFLEESSSSQAFKMQHRMPNRHSLTLSLFGAGRAANSELIWGLFWKYLPAAAGHYIVRNVRSSQKSVIVGLGKHNNELKLSTVFERSCKVASSSPWVAAYTFYWQNQFKVIVKVIS